MTYSIIVKVMMVLILLVVGSSLILVLINSGLVSVRAQADYENEQVLNMEFIPVIDDFVIKIKDFTFCQKVDLSVFNCLGSERVFHPGEQVNFLFIVRSNLAKEVEVIEDYALIGPFDERILDFQQGGNLKVKLLPDKDLTIADYFTLSEDALVGEYTLELLLRVNGKDIKQKERFIVE